MSDAAKVRMDEEIYRSWQDHADRSLHPFPCCLASLS